MNQIIGRPILRPHCLLSLTVMLTLFDRYALCHAQEHWPRFRGSDATGVAADGPRLPEKWSETDNVQWSTAIPGRGWSCPVIWGKRVFVTTVVNDMEYDAPKKGLYRGLGRHTPPDGVHHWQVFCLDLESGDVLWQREVYQGEPAFPRHPKSTYASETAATDGQRVYVLFGDLGLYCFDFDGNPVWQHGIETKKTFLGYGAAASPIVFGNQVIIVYDNQQESFIASFDSATGRQLWKTTREEKSTWATPFLWQTEQRAEIVVSGKREIHSYDLAGKSLWSLKGRMSTLVIPSPFASDDLLYVTSGYVGDFHRPVYAVRPGATGDITLAKGTTSNKFVQWYLPKAGPYNTSPIVYRGRYYTLHDRGFFTAHDAATGAEIYGKQRFPKGASFTASPWAYQGKIFCLSEDGDTFVIQAGDEFKVLDTNPLGELCLATPGIAQGKLLIRTATRLYCIGK